MSSGANLNDDVIARAELTNSGDGITKAVDEKPTGHMIVDTDSAEDGEDWWEGKPTKEEMVTLRRVSGKIKWSMWTIAFVELCERFSYYGSAVLYTNYVRASLPPGSTTGAPDPNDPNGVPGALGQGLKTSQAISLFNQFFAYIMPLLG